MFCSNCGEKLPENVKFCPNCGTKVELPVVEAPEITAAVEEAEETLKEEVADITAPIPPVDAEELESPEVTSEIPLMEAAPAPEPVSEEATEEIPAEAPVSEEAPVEVPVEAPAPEPVPAAGPIPGPVPANAVSVTPVGKEPGKKKGKKGLIIALVAVAVIIAIAVIVPAAKKKSIEKKYAQAYDAYLSEDYETAAELFADLGDYEDAAALKEECDNAIIYAEATDLMNSGDYAGAEKLFDSISGYKDSEEQSWYCQNVELFNMANQFLDEEKYEDALLALEAVDLTIIPEAEVLMEYCRNTLQYNEACEYLEEGHKADAYEIFTDLGDFMDSQEKAENCLEPYPSNGEIYHNDKFKSNSVSLEIIGPTDSSRTYMKIYSGDTLVSKIFLDKNSRTKINLPAGTYTMKAAYGWGAWFGEEEMFGDAGSYSVLTFGSDETDVQLQDNYEYTLTLKTADNSGGDSVGNKTESREDF